MNDLNEVNSESVLFNFECCSSVAENFNQPKQTMSLLKVLIDFSYNIMFSDFAVKCFYI